MDVDLARARILPWLVVGLVSLLACSGAIARPPRVETIPLRHLAPERASVLLATLVPDVAVAVMPEPPSVQLVGSPRVRARAREWLGWLDATGGDALRVYVRPLVYREPDEMASLLQALVSPSEPRLRVVPDSRSRQLVVVAPPDVYARFERLVSRLDIASPGTRSLRVESMRDADASALRDLLQSR